MARRKNPGAETPAEQSGPVPDAPVETLSGTVPETEPASAPWTVPEDTSEPAQDGPAEASPPTDAALDPVTPEPPDPPKPPPAAVAAPGSGILWTIFGGALAAVGGFALAHFNAFGLAPPQSAGQLPALVERLSALEARAPAEPVDLAPLEDQLAGLQARIAALESAPAAVAPTPVAPDLSAMEALERRLAALEALPAGEDGTATAALAGKLAELEERLAAQPEASLDTSEVDAALARLAAAEAEAAARATAATEATEAARRGLALDRLRAAAATGGAFETELAALDDPDLTAALAPHAGGVPTLAALQADFADLARAALQTARATGDEAGWTGRLVDFLATQTNARPLTPLEGTTPDAILSRADFAVTEGRLADALSEIAALPPDVQAVLADWTAAATARLAVDAALEAP